MIQSFSANISQQVLDDLKVRVQNTRWPQHDDLGWSYGSNILYMRELTSYWIEAFDWRAVENEINSYPNFMAALEGYKIHFLHIKGKGKKSIPLLITHGWPGSFLEMMKLIPLLTTNSAFSFDLVIPSIIGFGFSSNDTQEGCNSAFVADLWHKLMANLGYHKYAAQGGDIGAGISSWLALHYPDNIIGVHLNYIPGSYKPFTKDKEQLSEEVLSFQDFANTWSAKEGAYAHVHSTKPLTLAYALNDSPVGLCAWIVEKFNSWSDNNGDVENVFTKHELLANVTLYWVTQTIYSSMRMYLENSKRPLVFRQNDFINVPVGFAKFPKELPTPPRSYIERGFNIQRWTEMPVGGHFAAMEQPYLLAKDIIDFFSEIV